MTDNLVQLEESTQDSGPTSPESNESASETVRETISRVLAGQEIPETEEADTLPQPPEPEQQEEETEKVAETVPIEEERPPVSDDLAVNYLQSPNYLYSGMGNLYQPYGYANNTLVDLLRTRNLTQPQQAAANLGLFGNPGDFV